MLVRSPFSDRLEQNRRENSCKNRWEYRRGTRENFVQASGQVTHLEECHHGHSFLLWNSPSQELRVWAISEPDFLHSREVGGENLTHHLDWCGLAGPEFKLSHSLIKKHVDPLDGAASRRLCVLQ